jgi:hypothetical protein
MQVTVQHYTMAKDATLSPSSYEAATNEVRQNTRTISSFSNDNQIKKEDNERIGKSSNVELDHLRIDSDLTSIEFLFVLLLSQDKLRSSNKNEPTRSTISIFVSVVLSICTSSNDCPGIF